MAQLHDVLLIQTGGTIDKEYPQRKGGYAFEIGEAAAARVLRRVCGDAGLRRVTVCRKDSQEIKHSDRELLRETCRTASAGCILITHGTDTIADTARFLSEAKLNKKIVLTGAFLPETFKDSDADFNIGMALGVLKTLPTDGVYVCMNGEVIPADEVTRSTENHNFISSKVT